MIFISHKLHEVMAVADRVTVLRGGRSIATVATADVTREELASLMVGRDVERRSAAATPCELGEVVLAAEGLSARGDRGVDALRDVSRLGARGRGARRRGGRGQRAARARGGAHRDAAAASAGTIEVAGQALRDGDPRAAIRAGVAHVPEDRLTTGVAPSLSIASNVVLKSYRAARSPGGRSSCSAGSATARSTLIRRYDVRAAGPTVPARQLSGGNLQKVVLAREFSGRAEGAGRRRADARARRRRDRDRPRGTSATRRPTASRCS